MALIERHEPKDAFDIYCLIKGKHFTLIRLLKLTQKKFSIKFPPSLFWSEGLLGAKRLNEIKPMLPSSMNKEKQIKETQEYFAEGAAQFVKNVIT